MTPWCRECNNRYMLLCEWKGSPLTRGICRDAVVKMKR
jgi:hypothetical protein